MAAVLAGCRQALVGTGWITSHFAQTYVETTPPLCRGSICGTVDSFQLEVFSGLKALTVESLLMSRCGQSYEPPENCSKKLWLKFPVLALSRSGNMDQKMYP